VFEIIPAGFDKLPRLHHDKMLPRDERRKTFASFSHNAATVGQADQHPVPFEITELGVMNVEQKL
jgi:hypothetical protein